MAKSATINLAQSKSSKKTKPKTNAKDTGVGEKGVHVDNRTWTLPRQEEYLKGRYTAYKEAAATKSSNAFNAFWSTTRSHFFTLYPDEEAELKEWAAVYKVVYTPPEGTTKAAASNAAESSGFPSSILGANAPATDVHSSSSAAINPAPAITDVPDMYQAEPRIPARIGNIEKWKEDRCKQLRNWMNNRVQSERRKTSKGATGPPQSPVNLASILKPSKVAAAGRVRTEEQIYSSIYYAEKIKTLVDAEIKATDAPFSDRIAIRTKFVKEAYAEESDDVKGEIRKLRVQEEEKRMEAAEMLRELVEDGGSTEYTPEQYGRVQEYLPYIIPHFFSIIGPASGCSFMVVGGGPQAANENGEIGFVSWCEGYLPGKVGFDDWVENWQADYVAPFGKFCHALFPEEVRLRRAINIVQNDKLNAEALARSGRGVGKLVYTGPNPTQPVDNRASVFSPSKHDSAGKPETANGGEATEDLSQKPDLGMSENGCSGDELGDSMADINDDPRGESLDAGAAAIGVSLAEFGRMVGASQEKMRQEMAGLAEETEKVLDRYQQMEKAKATRQLTDDHSKLAPPVLHLHPPANPNSGSGSPSSSFVPPRHPASTHGSPPRVQRKESATVFSPGLSQSPTPFHSRYPSPVNLLIVPEPSQSPEPPKVAMSKSSVPEPRKRRVAVDSEVEAGELPERREKRSRKAVEDWVTETYAFLSEAAEGDAWRTCVQAWYDFETKGFYTASTLGEKASRPAELSAWLVKRNYNNRRINDETEYGNRWLDWWGRLQSANNGVAGAAGKIKRAGKNGVVVALIGLAFWSKVGKDDQRWWNAVGEMIQVLQ